MADAAPAVRPGFSFAELGLDPELGGAVLVVVGKLARPYEMKTDDGQLIGGCKIRGWGLDGSLRLAPGVDVEKARAISQTDRIVAAFAEVGWESKISAWKAGFARIREQGGAR